MMPILLPVRVRRSVRATTVPATRPAVAPALHRARELGPGLHAQLLQHGGVIVERMAGEEEADRVVFALQPLGRQPGLDRRQRDRLARCRPPPNNSLCPTAAVLVRALRASRAWRRRPAKTRARFASKRVEGAGGGQAFQHALVDGARIDARGEVGEVGERRSPRAATIASTAWRADAFERGERVDGWCCLRPRSRRRSG